MPYEIDQSPNFEIIKYPFIDFKLYEHERLIPWKGSGIYSGVEQDPALVFQSGEETPAPTPVEETAKAPQAPQADNAHKVTPINSRQD